MKYLGRALFFVAALAAAQTSPTPAAAAPADQLKALQPVIQQQFGSTFTLAEKFATPVIAGDFDGDGIEDIVIVANSKDPLPDSYQYKYEVEDPYNGFFGFGNPQETSAMGRVDPRQNHVLLVIFGAGSDAWRAPTPKAKYALVNVPFDSIQLGRMLVKKKKPPIFVIKAVEAQLAESAIYFDAKKKHWRWQPGNSIE